MTSFPSSTYPTNGFDARSKLADRLTQAVEKSIFTDSRYINIRTGIEHRFPSDTDWIKTVLYRNMGPTTDLLRYFPDNLYIDRCTECPTWEIDGFISRKHSKPLSESAIGLFTFFVEYKSSYSQRERPVGKSTVPLRYIGQIEREAWLAYKRLTYPNPINNIYLDGLRARIALVYEATYAPGRLFAEWEHNIEPINDPAAIRKTKAIPNIKAEMDSTGSGTPWINFDIRTLKPLEKFLAEDLFWDEAEAVKAVDECRKLLTKR